MVIKNVFGLKIAKILGCPLQPPSKVASRKNEYPMTASEPNFLFYNALILSQENIYKKQNQSENYAIFCAIVIFQLSSENI